MGQFFSGMLSDTISWIGGIIAFAVFLGFLYVLGQTGSLIRQGIETKKSLKLAKEQTISKGLSINQVKYEQINTKATWMITLPILGWIIVYLIIFFVLPMWIFFWSLLLLIGPVLGYFGLYVAPDPDL